MRYISAILTLVLSSCIQPDKEPAIEKQKPDRHATETLQNPGESLLYGNWIMCKVEDDSVSMSFFICPRITFSKDGSGEIILAMKTHVPFQWQYAQGSLTMQDSLGEMPTIFFAQVPELVVTQYLENGSPHLMLTDLERNVRHRLAKLD